jgi:hypothetical protein
MPTKSPIFCRFGLIGLFLEILGGIISVSCICGEPGDIRPSTLLVAEGNPAGTRWVSVAELSATQKGDELVKSGMWVIRGSDWPSGMVPVYRIRRKGKVELRRRPLRGHESSSEPFFFGMPIESEPELLGIAGQWECIARHEDGSVDEFMWQIAGEADVLFGRFDPFTDYRFAELEEGSIQSSAIRLKVRYINNHYDLDGSLLKSGELEGTWTQIDDAGKGAWNAVRSPAPKVVSKRMKLVNLFEWIHSVSGDRAFSTAEIAPEASWQRTVAPLVRIWVESARGVIESEDCD